MNHTEAVESQASEKYLLGELSAELREEYEEHYFSCAECSDELRAAAELLAAGRRISSAAPAREPDYVRPPRGWFPWMNPLVVGPALAALLLVIAYQNLVSIPRYRKQSAAPQVLPMYSLLTANTRGDRGLVFSVAPGHSFGLYVDVPVDPAYSNYLLRLESPGGSTPLRSLSSKEAEKTQVIVLNPGRQAGNYALVIAGLADGADPSSARELARLQFTVELKD
jgi:hypothetical protein